MNIREDTESLFVQDKQYVLDYLRSRRFINRELNRIIRHYPFGLVTGASFVANKQRYSISHFLSCSQIMGYDIRKVNDFLDTEDSAIVAFALVLGDDALCYNTETKEVFLWRIQTSDGDQIFVSDNLTSFLKSLI